MDIATLGLRIDSRETKAATDDLRKLATAAEGAEKSTQRFERVQSEGSKAAAAHRAELRRQADAYRAAKTESDRVSAAVRDYTKLQEIGAQQAREMAAATAAQGPASTAAAGGFGTLRRQLSPLIADLIGVDARMAGVASRLLSLGVGSGIIAAVIAAVTAIGVAYRKLTQDFDDYITKADEAAKIIAGDQATAMATAFHQAENLSGGLQELSKQTATFWSLNPASNWRAFRNYWEGFDVGAAAATRYANALGAVLTQHQKLATDRGIDSFARTLSGLGKQAGLGPLSDASLASLTQIRDVLGGALGGNITLQQRDRLQGLLDQADSLLRAQEKVAGLWTKLSSGPIQQGLTALERAAQSVPTILQGINALGRPAAPVVDNTAGYTTVTGNYTPQILLGAAQREGLVRDLNTVKDTSRDTATAWDDIARAALGFAQAITGANDSMILALQNAVSLAAEVQKAVAALKLYKATQGKEGGLGAANVLGLFGAAGGLISSVAGLFGDSQRQAQQAQTHLANIERILDLIRQQGGFGLLGQTPGSTVLGVQRALTGFGSPGPQGLFLKQALGAQGLGLTDLAEVAKGLGISFAGAIPTAKELQDVLKAIAAADLTRFRQTFTGQLELLQNTFDLFDITDPLEKLKKYLELIQNPQFGAPGIGGQLGQFDLNSAAGRAAAEAFIQQQFGRFNLDAANGGFTLADLGGLSPEQLRDYFLTFEGLLDQVNSGLQQTVDNLKAFADSLKLDQSLTTLSPVQQLVEARRQYQAVLAAAQGGDQTAAAQLPAVARAFLEASRAVNASGPAYAADFARVLAETDALTKLFSGQATQQDEIVKYTGEMAFNTKALVTKQDDQIAVLQEGFTRLLEGQTAQQATLNQLVRWSKTTANSLN